MAEQQTYYFPWYRKGLGNSITETDVLGGDGGSALARPEVKVVTGFKVQGVPHLDENKKVVTPDPVKLTQKKTIKFVGPGDVLSVSSSAVMKVNPAPDSDTFPVQYFPYLEFWEADFPWRYTPASPDGQKLRPWLALIVCKSEDITIQRPGTGLEYFTFKGDNESFSRLFINPSDLHKTAHAQGDNAERAVFSRSISLRNGQENLEENTQYTALLVPTFETGRLRGLGNDSIDDIVAQAPAWETSIEKQKSLHTFRPLDFPIYYKWTFRTASDSFDALAEKLTYHVADKPGIKLDVTKMGEGLDYDVKSKGRKTITMPAATVPLDLESTEKPFPDPSDAKEKKTYENLKTLLNNNPVFNENRGALEGKAFMGEVDPGDDDPMVVPPVYGARHALATELESSDKSQQWVKEINLDIHNRAAAGLGKKVIQNNQEELVNRAWKQVEAVKALNVLLYNRLISMRANQSLINKTVGSFGKDDAYIAAMMKYLATMKNAGGDVSLSSIIADKQIPAGFASASFRNLSDRASRKLAGLDSTTLIENIVRNQSVYNFIDSPLSSATDIEAFRKKVADIRSAAYAVLVNGNPSINKYSEVEQTCYSGAGTLCNDSFKSKSIGSIDFSCPYKREIDSQKRRYDSDTTSPAGLYKIFTDVAEKLEELMLPIYGYAEPDVLSIMSNAAARTKTYDKDDVITREATEIYKSFESIGAKVSARGTMAGQMTSAPNVICLPSKEYKSAFGSKKPITVLGTGRDARYYVDIFELRNRYSSGDSSVKNKPLYWGQVLEGTYTVYSLLPMPLSVILVTEGFTSLKDTYFTRSVTELVTNWSMTLGSRDRTYGFTEAEWKKIQKSYQKSFGEILTKVEEYLDLPVFFAIDSSKLDDSISQTFSKPSEYIKFLENPEECTTGLVKSIVGLDKYLSDLEPVEEPVETEQEVTEEEIKEETGKLSQEFLREEAFARMAEVAKAYYSIFFSDTEVGKKLRDEYIDELLMSKHPIIAYPIFPEPTYHYLKLIDEGFVLPGAADIPSDSVSLVVSNPAFEESFLCGMNTEMGQELLWREYPTDQRGSYFRKFWDSETDEASIAGGNYFDIKAVHTWDKPLGNNHMASKDGLVIFIVKGKLMRMYPSTDICLTKAKLAGTRRLDFDDSAAVIRPVMQSFLNEDVFLVGFKADFNALLGNPSENNYGYILTFTENVDDLNFTSEKSFDTVEDSAAVASTIVNLPSRYGKHISLFIK